MSLFKQSVEVAGKAERPKNQKKAEMLKDANEKLDYSLHDAASAFKQAKPIPKEKFREIADDPHRLTKQRLRAYLQVRYGANLAEKMSQVFQIAGSIAYDDFCEQISGILAQRGLQ